MSAGKATISHVVLFCYDFPKMLDFYTKVLGFHLSDIGRARGNDICFLTLDPESDHHQLALASGRQGPKEAGALNHVAFRVGSLAELRRRHDELKQAGVQAIELITHGSWLSVYYRDPEGNRMEFFWDTPYYVQQPIVEPLHVDLGATEEEAWRAVEERYGQDPSFKPMTQWKAEAAKAKADAAG
jgi:catechol 2,3-dioxygenase-like lactoylglutathione lyase family enzyme